MTILVSIFSGFGMWTIPGAHVEALRREFPADTIRHAVDDEETRELIEEAEIAFAAFITPDQLRAARRLQWVHCPAAGVGHLLYPEMVESGVTITNGRPQTGHASRATARPSSGSRPLTCAAARDGR